MALSGPSARVGATISASIEDIASTILYLSAAPVPLDLEGRVLEEALDSSLLTDRPPEYSEAGTIAIQGAQSYSAGEAAEVEDRLRDLGYVE